LKKISFVAHGLHLNKYKIEQETDKYFAEAYDISFLATKSNLEAEYLAEKSINDGADYLIAVGGDGTMNEVVNGIMHTAKEKREKLIVGLLPVGSGNDFARTLNLSKKISDLHSLINNNQFTPIDIGRLQYKSINDEDRISYFINITDVGLGAEVAKRVNEGNKTYGPNMAFFAATLKTFMNYRKKKIKIESAEFNWSGNVLAFCLANAKYFGSGLCIAPHAKVNDGKIAITLAGDVGLIDYLKNMMKIRKGTQLKHPGIMYNQVEDCFIEPIGKECLIEADGEMIGKIPLRVTLLKHEINFLTSASL
jgi:YegS/Rv2252/BmrU family lipid kinase